MQTNVLIILTDQQAFDAMSCVGNRDLHTPALDALAAVGMRASQAYCAQPLCTPSRASMLTGRMPSELETTVNGVGLREPFADASLGRLFARAGYDCGYAGKWHLPEIAAPPSSGFERVHGADDHMLAEACVEFLQRPRERPFLLVASLNEPHGICEWARGQTPPSGPVPNASPDEWPALPTNYRPGSYQADLPQFARQRMPHTHPTEGWDEDTWRRYRHAYFRLCERADHEIGKVLAALQDSGQTTNTLIIFTADHGDGLGAHQWNQKWALHEEAARVPLIIVPPGGLPSGHVVDHLVSTGLDLLPTVCDYTGVTPPADLPGRSLRPVVERSEKEWRDMVICETTWDVPGLNNATGRMVRTERFKYVCYAWGRNREQLFDLTNDPGEMSNLASTFRYRSVVDDHRRRLHEFCRATADPFVDSVPTEGSRR